MSLELVLAALYPPTGTPLDWSSGANLNWQPIPYKELQYDTDHVIKKNQKKLIQLQFFINYS